MGRMCQVTGKKPVTGRKYTTRGIAVKKGGVGKKTTGITKRRFLPNLFKKRFWFAEENRFITLRITPNGMRSIERVGVAAMVRKLRSEGVAI